LKIELNNLGKYYNINNWVFRNLNWILEGNGLYYVCGSNGSGKSTLCNIIAGLAYQSEGDIFYYNDKGSILRKEYIYRYISIVSPYVYPPSYLKIKDLYKFNKSFNKKFEVDYNDFISFINIENDNKYLYEYSSGQRQKIFLAFSILSGKEIIIFDEPYAYLDSVNEDWLDKKLKDTCINKIIIITDTKRQNFYNKLDLYKINL